METKLAQVLANLTGPEARAVYEFLAQAVENARVHEDECEGDDEFKANAHLEAAEGVVDRLNEVFAGLR